MLRIAVPAPIFRHTDGRIDYNFNSRCAQWLGATWVQHIIISGPMGHGEACTPGQRMELADLWAAHVDPSRLIAACWTADEMRMIRARGIRSLAMLACDTDDTLLAALLTLPPLAVAYTNPRYGRVLITPELLARLSGSDMPQALKFSKVTIGDLARVRQVVGPDVTILHGSSRRITGSFAAGVDIIVSSPLAALPSPWPAPTIDAVQNEADRLQSILDQEGDHWARVTALNRMARKSLLAEPPPWR